MTLILNILHKDMSILAADKRAQAEWSSSPLIYSTAPPSKGQVVNDFNKFTLNTCGTLALVIAGITKDHSYTLEVERSESIDESLRSIRKHIESFVPIYDRAVLAKLRSFMPNEGIATFFDQSMGGYFTYQYLFSPIELRSRLLRGAEEVKVLYAGSGVKYFEQGEGLADIEKFKSSNKNSYMPCECISWVKDLYKRVSVFDPEIGDEPDFLVSTRDNHWFSASKHG